MLTVAVEVEKRNIPLPGEKIDDDGAGTMYVRDWYEGLEWERTLAW
jgi:hypothetical protein